MNMEKLLRIPTISLDVQLAILQDMHSNVKFINAKQYDGHEFNQ